MVRTDGRAYGHVITKFSWMGSLPHFLTHGAPQARFARQSSANNDNNNKSGLLIKSSRLEISELRNYFTKISSRIFENIPQNGPEYSHRKLAIARKNIGGLLSWLVSLSSSVPELTRRGLKRPSQSLEGEGAAKAWYLPLVLLCMRESVHWSCLPLVCHVKFL